MAKHILKCFTVSLLLFAGSFLEAQSEQGNFGWRVYQAEGNVVIARNGVRILYPGGSKEGAEPLEKITLKSKDLVQTSNGKAEMQMVFNGSREETYTVIKICENTTVLINDNPGKGGHGVELLYGRMRVITGTTESAIIIRAGTSVVNLQNGDVAMDFIAKVGVTLPILTFHCFDGKGEFVPRPATGTGAVPLPLKASETIFLDNQGSMSYVEKKPLDAAVITYWNAVPFSNNAPLPSPASGLASLSGSKQAENPENATIVTEKQEQKQKKEKQSRRSGNLPTLKDGIALAGLLLAVTGTALQAYTLLGNPDPAYKNKLYYSSYIPMGVGVGFILSSSFFSSNKAASD